MRRLLLTLAAAAMLTACGSQGEKPQGLLGEPSEKRAAMEELGQECLDKARAALERHDYDKARNCINELRDKYALALNAREEGILLADSIDWLEAKAQLKAVDDKILRGSADSTKLHEAYDELLRKVKFYQRKIQYDQANRKKY